MKLNDYVGLTPKQKIAMMQRDLPQIERDVAIYKKLNRVAEFMGSTFIQVNAWWNRPVNRSKEDYTLAQAVIANHKAQQGQFDQLDGPREVLNELLEPWHKDIEEAIQGRAGKTDMPAHDDDAGIRRLWAEKGLWGRSISEQTKNQQLDAVAFFWNPKNIEAALAKAAYGKTDLPLVQDMMYKQAHFLRKAFVSFGAIEQNFDNRAVVLRSFYASYKDSLAQMYGKSEAEKTAILNQEKVKFSNRKMWDKAELSLRPEGRNNMYKWKRLYMNGKVSENDEDELPEVISLGQELKTNVKNNPTYQKAVILAQNAQQAVKTFWSKPVNKKRTAVAVTVGVLSYAGYVALKDVDDAKADPKSTKEFKNDKTEGWFGEPNTSYDEPEYEDEDVARDADGNPVMMETFDAQPSDSTNAKSAIPKSLRLEDAGDNTDAANDTLAYRTDSVSMHRDSLTYYVDFKNGDTAPKNSVLALLVSNKDLDKVQKSAALNLLPNKLDENGQDVVQPAVNKSGAPAVQNVGQDSVDKNKKDSARLKPMIGG